MSVMTPRGTVLGIAVLSLTIVGGCGSNTRDAAQTAKVADAATPTGHPMLAVFDNGVGVVATGSTAPIWLEPNAVAAPDGTSVFSVRPDAPNGADRLVRIDPHAGNVISSWALRTQGLSIAAVFPKGRWIALTDRKPGYGSQGRASTDVVVFDSDLGTEAHRMHLVGDVQPEALSTDGTLMFALHYVADHYRVQTIQLATGDRYDTSDRDKQVPPEDMHGHAIHGVMSKDRTLLATLYRKPGNNEEPAFVHVLDLQHGWSYCADLPAPFGTGTPGSDVIELTRADTVVIAATQADRLAEIHIDDVRTPVTAPNSAPVRVKFRDGTIPSPDAPFRSMPGFEYVLTEPAA
jgi:hypothetical protein